MSAHRTPYTAWKLYVLCDPKALDPDEPIRYVGISNHTRRRFKEHLDAARTGRGGNPGLRTWLRRLKKQGSLPVMKVYHFEGSLEAMRRQEASVIRQLRRQDATLLNCQHNTTPRFQRWPRKRSLPRGRTLRHPTLKKKLSGRVVPR